MLFAHVFDSLKQTSEEIVWRPTGSVSPCSKVPDNLALNLISCFSVNNLSERSKSYDFFCSLACFYSVFLVLVLKSFYCLFPFMFLFYSSFLLLFLPFFFFLSFFYFSSSLFFIPSLRLPFCLISLLYHSSFPSLSLPFFELSSISLCLSIFIDGRVKVRLRCDHSDGVNVSMRKLISGHR